LHHLTRAVIDIVDGAAACVAFAVAANPPTAAAAPPTNSRREKVFGMVSSRGATKKEREMQ
jgi:hypothetical protein